MPHPILLTLIMIMGAQIGLSTDLAAQCAKSDKRYAKAAKLRSKQPQKAEALIRRAFADCPGHVKSAYALADMAMEEDDYLMLKSVLLRHHEATGQLKNQAWLALAESARSHHAYDEAIAHFDTYLELDTNITGKTVRARLDRRSSDYARQAYRHPEAIDFYRLPEEVNSGSSEYLAIMPADEQTMLFTRRARGREDAQQANHQDGAFHAVVPLLPQLDRFKTAAMTISPDGEMMALAINGHPQGLGSFDLFYMERDGQRWVGPKSFGPVINTPGWESQPCFSADGRTLYFVSHRKGGEGGSDLWYSRRLPSGEWQKPINLGPPINTRYNEESPYLHRDQQRLFFRSNGHPGLGDFDLFVSTKQWTKDWSIPENLGYPINSIGNDGSFFLRNDGKTAIIASDVDRTLEAAYTDQRRMGHIDLFQFVLPEAKAASPVLAMRLQIIDDATEQPLAADALLIQSDRSDTLYTQQTDKNGRITLVVPTDTTYGLSIRAQGYLPHFERYLGAVADGRGIIDSVIRLTAIPAPQDTVYKPVILQNILFVSGESVLIASSMDEIAQLEAFLKAHPAVRITIRGHTDNVGSSADNLALSDARAKAVYDILIQRGIDARRLKYAGLGETQPIASNETEQGRQKNRRVDFIVQ